MTALARRTGHLLCARCRGPAWCGWCGGGTASRCSPSSASSPCSASTWSSPVNGPVPPTPRRPPAHRPDSAKCRFEWQNFHDSYAQIGLVGVILVFLPGLVGAFAGAPVLARELETGTFRYTWTQGVGRMRWAVAVLVPGAVGVAVIIGAFGCWSVGTTSRWWTAE